MTWLRWMIFGILGTISQGMSASPDALIYPPQAELPAPDFNLRELRTFDELRHTILQLISGSKRRIWLLTDYLTDGDIVSALYVAKYRKIDVKVFLGRHYQHAYLSRLSYLRSHGIPVYVRPESGYSSPTLLLVDQRLYSVNRDLNVLNRHLNAQIGQASPFDVKGFYSWFRTVIENPEPTAPSPRELNVGRSRPSKRWVPSAPVVQEEATPYTGEMDGSFNYDRSVRARKAPDGIPHQLPRVPRWKEIQEMRQKGEYENEPELPPPENAPRSSRETDSSPSESTAPHSASVEGIDAQQ